MKTKKLIFVIAIITAVSMVFAACSQTERLGDDDSDISDKVDAEESTYDVGEMSEEYAGVTYTFPTVEGMVNKSKQADANGHLKRLTMATAKDNNGERGPISNTYEVMVANTKILSVIFPTTLDYDMETRTFNMLIEHHKVMFSIENLFGRAEDNAAFADMRAVFEEAGADSSISDDDFRKKNIYFEGEDMTELILHVAYFTDDSYDIAVSFNEVYPYLQDDVVDMFDFTQ